mgnify:CR=1 FL=1
MVSFLTLPALSGPALAPNTMESRPRPPAPREAASQVDDALVSRARSGDASAFREIFVRHRSDVARIVYRMIGLSSDVEDVVQEVFLHVYRSLPSFRGDSRFSTWLYRLSVNVTRMHLRRARSRPRFSDVEVPEGPREGGPPTETPDVVAERGERVRTLYRLLEALSEKKREVLVLHDFEGVPAKEISDIVGAPVLTVRTRLFYARKELYAAMSAEPSLAGVVEALVESLPGKPQASAARERVPTPEPVIRETPDRRRESRP